MESSSLAVLDCESYQSSVKSLSDLYCVDGSAIVRTLRALDFDRECERNPEVSPDELLLALFESSIGTRANAFQRVCWFHLTRVPPETDFDEGILPLHDALDKIWRTIISIPSDPDRRTNLKQLRESGVPDYQYEMKTGNRLHSGPFAMLVRESAFNARSMCNHDYLALPEIIEDICNGYLKQFGTSIHDEVSAALRPCIVKFEVADEETAHLIRPVLRYCFHKERGQELSFGTNTCYDGEGKPIPRSAIHKIEFP